MRGSIFIALLMLTSLPCLGSGADEVWIIVSRPSKNKIVYKIGEQELANLDDIAANLMERRKLLSKFPAVRSIFEPACTFEDFSNLRGWLGKVGVIDSKYFLTDSAHRAIAEFGMLGHQLTYPKIRGTGE